MRDFARGNALPETAIVASLMLLLLFGALNVALLGYNQLQADAAAFVGARTASTTSISSPSSVATAAANQIAAIFPHVQSGAVHVTTGGTNAYTTTTSISMTSPGLPFLLGRRSSINVLAHAVEPAQSSTPPASGLNFSISSSTLKNYYNPSTWAPDNTHQALLAFHITTYCNDQAQTGNNPCTQGVMSFDSICGHNSVYQQLTNGSTHSWPNTRATAVSNYNSKLSPTNSSTTQYQIAQWDAGNGPTYSGACGSVPYYPTPPGR